MPALLTVKQAAVELSLSRDSVYGEIRSGRLRAVRVGKGSGSEWRVPVEALPEFISSLVDNQSSQVPKRGAA